MSESIGVDLFTQFWEAFPKDLCNRKGSKTLAKKSWDKLDDKIQSHALLCMRELMRADRALLKNPREFVPKWGMASTWINQCRWDDIEEIRQSHGTHKAIASLCQCGQPVEIAHKCRRCYEATSEPHKVRMQLLYDNLVAMGMGIKDNETKEQWHARCRQHACSNMGRALDKGA